MANDLNRSIKIYIDGTDSAQEVNKIEAAIGKLEAKLSGLNQSEADYATKSKRLQQEINNKNKTLQTYNKKIEETNRVLKNLSGATYNELIAVQSQVRKNLRDSIPGTDRHTAALEQNRRVTEALTRAQTAMRVEVGSQGNAWSRSAGFINKYIGLAGTALAAITGVSMKLNQLRDKRDQREEAKADVEALTGLDKESINWLEQQAKLLSTTMDESGIRIRQSATEILDAFKLVGSAKPELLDDKEALAQVTKETLILASASGMTLKDAVDAVTLSMNQYGASADQASRYTNVMAAGSKYGSAAVESVTSAITKSGVAAASAGVPIEELVGTIETLAEKGIKDEIAGTGLKKFFLTLQTGADETNPAIVGLETALDNLQKKQLSAAAIKKQFGEEGYNVASVLINEADKVKYYTKAVTDTTVAMEQAATKSDTAAAKRDQAKNKLEEIGIELMTKLNPAITSVMNSTVNWGSKLVTLIGFLTEHSRTIGLLVAVIGGYIVVSKAQIVEEKLKFFWQERVIASMKRAYAVMIAHPYAAVAVAVLALITYFRSLNRELSESERIEQTLTDIRKKSTDSVRTERSEVEQMLGIARNENLSKGEREAAIRRLNEISPEYLGNITLEKANTEEATAAVNSYIDSLIILEDIKRTNDKMNELRDQKDELLKNNVETTFLEDVQAGAANILNGFKTSLGLYTDEWADNVLNTYTNKGLNQIRAIDTELQALNQHIEESRKSLIKVESEKPTTESKNPASGGLDAEAAKKLLKSKLDAEAVIYAKHQADLKAMYLTGQDETLQTEKQYNAEMERLQLEHYQRIINITGTKSKEGIDAQNAINDIKINQRKARISQQIDEEKVLYEKQQNDLKQLYASGNDENLRTEEAYNEAMQQLALMHLERSLSIAEFDADQRRAIEKQLLDFKVKCMTDEAKERKRLDEKASRDRDAQAKKEQQQYQRRAAQYSQYGQQLGDALGNIISKQENAMAGFGETMVDIVFDVLTQILNAEMIKLTGVGISAAAEVTAREIGSKGFWGIASGLALSGLIAAGIATARSGLKGIIGKRRDDGASGSPNTEAPKTAQVQVSQWATGRYDVIGEDDGRTYNDIPYIGPAPTGIVHRTSLISENGAELIINADDLSRLQRHINYPVVLQAIQDSRSGRVPQRAQGNYTPVDTPNNQTSASAAETSATDTELTRLINELVNLIAALKNLKAYVVLRDIHNAEELERKSTEPFTKQKQ